MIPVSEALNRVLECALPLPPVHVVLQQSLSRVLAEDIISTSDSPPHDKALMDGYALRWQDAREGAELRILEQVTAGETPRVELAPGAATRIMTGAPIPVGTEVVIPVEQTQTLPGNRVQLQQLHVRQGDHILRRGAAMRVGETVLRRGRRLRPMELGLLAEIGASNVHVFPQPTIAIAATGNELVAHEHTPANGQIRNSNGPMLVALAERANAAAHNLGIARDDPDQLKEVILRGLRNDVLVLSGGVSAGVMDLIPAVLVQSGVQPVFHQIDLKPGKPLWFGTYVNDRHRCLVFGLPGNPVSSLVCFELFVKAAIAQLGGLDGRSVHQRIRARLTTGHQHRDKRLTYFPAILEQRDEVTEVTPLSWKGSADLRALVDANALIIFSSGPRTYDAGESVDVHLLS